ncbi:hypothetical protein WME79_01825 [Sorangium sp. So ce726]|uniref:hypothetical protein n=1 Tax=Sorangium sp. So ce726 TaxID=3133319 RepID=UPI003F615C3E
MIKIVRAMIGRLISIISEFPPEFPPEFLPEQVHLCRALLWSARRCARARAGRGPGLALNSQRLRGSAGAVRGWTARAGATLWEDR